MSNFTSGTKNCKNQSFLFVCFCNIFLFNINYNWKVYFINRKLQKKKKRNTFYTHFIHPSGYWKPTPFAFSLCVPPIHYSKAQLGKVSNKFGLQIIFSLWPFFPEHIAFFFMVYWNIFLYVFNCCYFCN